MPEIRKNLSKNNQSRLLAIALQPLAISASILTSRSSFVQRPLGTADKGVAHNGIK